MRRSRAPSASPSGIASPSQTSPLATPRAHERIKEEGGPGVTTGVRVGDVPVLRVGPVSNHALVGSPTCTNLGVGAAAARGHPTGVHLL